MRGDVRLELHHPIRREIVFRTDAPWEGNPIRLHFVLKDADLYSFQFVPYTPAPNRPNGSKPSPAREK